MDSLNSTASGIHLPNNQYRNEPQGDRTTWEYHTVSVTRVQGYGFGIAVSGGRDNPHFATGDPSIAVSDVLKGGPAEDRLQVNDRIISVNGVSLENVEYATAVQVLRDSGNTVTLVVKRRVSNMNVMSSNNGVVNGNSLVPNHQHSNSMLSSSGLNGASPSNGTNPHTIKCVLTRPNKKDDFGIVLGCRLFVKEISSKARDQLLANGYTLQEGDIVTRIHNTNTSDAMSLKEARKIIDGCKERLNLMVLRDPTTAPVLSAPSNLAFSHAPQTSNCSNADESFLNSSNAYSSQNLYVQPPTRPAAIPPSASASQSNNVSLDDKSNLTPRGRSRGPITDASVMQLDRSGLPQAHHSRNRSISGGGVGGSNEDFYSSRRQLYDESVSTEPRFISFQKEGSVGIRLTGGNETGIFVTAVQAGSPASLQGLMPGDKILKVNDMDMQGVTREEAVLFLLSLQDRIDLIVQHRKDEHDAVVANQRGDSFHIKTHFHCDSPTKGELSFKAGDVFRVVDTLHNGVVGSWQVLRIGRTSNQEMQRGVIPNKARAEELATAQFNASKKEMNASESRTSFFRRRRSSNHRRSKSLSRENWDDVVFSDTISKFPAYERVVLRHPGFVRPVVLFGPTADLARERLIKEFPDKFTAPLQADDKASGCGSSAKSAIIRLSNIRDIMDRGKHALLDITPNAVDRLNYAQFYPIVIFLKTESKHTIKQLRQGVPKTAHKSSKKLLEQCLKLDRVWSHVFSSTIVLNETDAWYRKLRDTIDQLQSGAVWMSESKPIESLSDDFLFPMTTSRLSYASSPESDLEMSPGPSSSLSLGNLPQLVKSNSDPSIATNQDNLERDIELNNLGEGMMPPPYTNPYSDHSAAHLRRSLAENKFNYNSEEMPETSSGQQPRIAPDLPPRIDRASKPNGVTPPSTLLPTPTTRNQTSSASANGNGTYGRTAQERLFAGKTQATENSNYSSEYATRGVPTTPDKRVSDTNENSLERKQVPHSMEKRTPMAASKMNGSSYDSMSSYDSTQLAMQSLRLGPNAPDDLKSVPNSGRPLPPTGNEQPVTSPRHSIHHSESMNRPPPEHLRNLPPVNDPKANSGRPYYGDPRMSGAEMRGDRRPGSMAMPHRPTNLGLDITPPRKQIQAPIETKTDYGKYSRNSSMSQADYGRAPKSPLTQHHPSNGSNGNSTAFKPVPPPKPKNYRPMMPNNGMNPTASSPGQWENGDGSSPRNQNGFYYSSAQSHYHQQQATHGPPIHAYSHQYPNNGMQMNGNNGNYASQQQAAYVGNNMNGNGYNGNHPYNGSSQYMHRGQVYPGNMAPPLQHHSLDLAGSREQRGSAFELYRKPQLGNVPVHHHNISGWEQQQQYPPPQHQQFYSDQMMYDNRSQYSSGPMSPPTLPPKSLKKKLLKGSLAAIKNAFVKSTKPLRRQNSLVEQKDRNRASGLRRQHSMMESRSNSAYGMRSPHLMHREQQIFYDDAMLQQRRYYNEEVNYMNQEQIYDNYANVRATQNYYEQENVYANRALIELERQAHEQKMQQQTRYETEPRSGGRIVRRHSMADRTRASPLFIARCEREITRPSRTDIIEREDIYQTRSGAFMMDPNAMHRNARDDEIIYQSRREMHLDHLYQSKKEMQQRIHQGRVEVERATHSESPSLPSSSSATTPIMSDSAASPLREQIYQSRRELKQKGFKTRTELRDHIYQTRREAMESMAEPSYVSKKRVEIQHHEEPMSDERDANISSDSRLDSKSIQHDENNVTTTESMQSEQSKTSNQCTDDETIAIEPVIANQNSRNSSGSDDEEPSIKSPNQSELQNTVIQVQTTQTAHTSQATPAPMTDIDEHSTPLSPRADRAHLSNMIKRIAPHPPPRSVDTNLSTNFHASCTSMETNYTSSQISLPIGPPAAQSTPYNSEITLENQPNLETTATTDGECTFYPPLREQSTTRGVVDENGGTLCDNVWNVSINIPKGAIPSGVQQEIYFTVTDPRLSQTVGGPPLDMENGETMLSPLVMCGPQGLEFLVPVTLNIPHCASRTASLGLSLKATDSEKNLTTSWDNIELPSNTAAHTVSVKVDHF